MAERFTDLASADGQLSAEALLEQVAGMAAIYGGVQADAQTLLDLVGGGQVVAWFFDAHSAIASAALVRQGDHWYAWIAGTLNTDQWIGNVSGALWPRAATGNVVVHGYFESVSDQLWTAGQSYLPPVGGDTAWTLVGHSLGGAVAQLIALRFAERYGADRVEVLTLAQPRALTLGLNGPALWPRYYRVRVPGDPVPMLPPTAGETVVLIWISPGGPLAVPYSWHHYGQGWILNQQGQLTPDGTPSWWEDVPFSWLATLDPRQHYIRRWGQYLQAQ